MVNFPPLAPSADWISSFISFYLTEENLENAIVKANCWVSDLKSFGRIKVTSPEGKLITLSVALEGGSRQLRSIDNTDNLRLSDHGNWRKTHLGTLDALLGKTPLYREIEPAIIKVYNNPAITFLRDFNSAIFKVIYPFFMGTLRKKELLSFYNDPKLKERGQEIADNINPEVSLLEIISKLGKESILGIMALRG